MVESFVSEKIASASKVWAHASTSAEDAIVVDKDELEEYIKDMRQYYLDVRNALVQAGVIFEVFEYDRDLRQATQQVGTLKRIAGLLFGPSAEVSSVQPKTIFEHVGMEKQAIVPLHEQVKNWDEVLEWGYGGETEEWEDLFQEEVPSCWDQNE